MEEAVAGAIASDTADEFATVIFDNQIQGMNDDVLMQIIRDSVKAHKSDLDLSDDEVRKLY
ncbi:MAG: hypothetical protein IJO87_10905, partial [Eggerthellaceae bacterium]|nr:hypothetical protein [Eggerthellaceae bacterium]